jgi:hypothetical protein
MALPPCAGDLRTQHVFAVRNELNNRCSPFASQQKRSGRMNEELPVSRFRFIDSNVLRIMAALEDSSEKKNCREGGNVVRAW